jgi:hypothetical protein
MRCAQPASASMPSAAAIRIAFFILSPLRRFFLLAQVLRKSGVSSRATGG